jgi:hypothetical protein
MSRSVLLLLWLMSPRMDWSFSSSRTVLMLMPVPFVVTLLLLLPPPPPPPP